MGIDAVHVDWAGVQKRIPHGFLRDLVERHAEEIRILPAPQQLAQMPGNGFAFAVRVGTEVNFFRGFGGRLEFTDGFDSGFCDLVGGLELVLDIDAESLLRQIANMPHRCFNDVLGAKILVDRLGFRRRLNNDQFFCHNLV